MKLTDAEREKYVNKFVDNLEAEYLKSAEERQIALDALRNNIPKYWKKLKAEREERKRKLTRKIIIGIAWILLISAIMIYRASK